MTRKLWLPWILLLQLALFASAASAGNDKTVLVVGDSLSAGLGVPAGANWVDLLRAELARSHPAARVVNASISGETSGGARERLAGLLAQHAPAIVVIELGGNDALRGFPLDILRANLVAMIESARAAGARVLLLGMRIPPNYGPRYTEGFHALYGDIAATQAVPAVPFLLEGIATDPTLMQADGIHPTAAAQPRLLANVLPALLPLLDGP